MTHSQQDAVSQPRRGFLLSMLGAAAVPGLLLPGCGGAATASVRFMNGTIDFASADFGFAGSRAAAAIANGGTTTSWLSADSGSSQVTLSIAGSSTASLTETHEFADDSWTSVLAYGALSQGVKFRYLDEADAAPDSGSVKLRVLQASPLLGSLDVYVSNETSLSGLAPTFTVSGYDALTDFVTLASGAWRIRITASGVQGTVLFDLGATVSLGSKAVVTLVVVPRASGSLPDLVALPEQQDASVLDNALV